MPGGVLMVVGALSLIGLKLRADPALAAARVWGGEMAFVVLLGGTALTGLALYATTGTIAVRPLLAIHLATVLALFVLMPWSKIIRALAAHPAAGSDPGNEIHLVPDLEFDQCDTGWVAQCRDLCGIRGMHHRTDGQSIPQARPARPV